jgi:cell division protein FtsI (penicillin-binding protein 3)
LRSKEGTLVRTALTRILLPCLVAACGAPRAPSHGEAVVALDARIQRIAGEELDRIVVQWSPSRAVVVVLDPKSGEVLAMDGRTRGQQESALASTHAWVTGSTLKTLTLAAALEERTITLDQRFGCGTRVIGSAIFHDASETPCDTLDAAGVLAQSSNVGTSYVFDALGSARLMPWLVRLHVGDAPGELPKIDDDRSLHAVEFASGEVAKATPLQMAAAYAAIFNDGVYFAPSFDHHASAGTRVLKEDTARTLVQMLEGAVGGDGTGKRARIAGARVAGKTGTAGTTDEAGADVYYASFIGSVLDREPRFVALVGLEVPEGKGTGASAAAPAWRKLALRILSDSNEPGSAYGP